MLRFPSLDSLVLCFLLAMAALCLPLGVSGQEAGPGAEQFEGLLRPSKRVSLNAPRDGVLARIEVEEGAAVKQGVELAAMDDRLQALRVEAARVQAESDAEVRAAALAVEEARINLERQREVFAQGAASDWEVRRAQLDLDQARVEAEAAAERRTLAGVQQRLEEQALAEHSLEAPFDGRVVRIVAERGATLTRQEPVMELVDLSELHAEVYVPIERFPELEVGRVYPLELMVQGWRDEDRRVTGRLRNADPVSDPASRSFRAVFVVENRAGRLPSGVPVVLTSTRGEAFRSDPSDGASD